jgi:hypothetical protein
MFSRTICLDWPRTEILPISASQIARIPGVNLQHLESAQQFSVALLHDHTMSAEVGRRRQGKLKIVSTEYTLFKLFSWKPHCTILTYSSS